MLLATVNGIFGAGFMFFAIRALQRGWPFLKLGWLTMQTQSGQPDVRQNVERRRAVSEGGRFLLGGLMWLGAGVVAGGIGLYFTLEAYRLLYGGG